MKNSMVILSVFLLLQNFSFGQLASQKFTSSNLESKILTYDPVQRAGVSDDDFSFGSFVLERMKESVASDNLKFNNADYWNMSVAFLRLGEPKEHVAIAFLKAIDGYEEGICDYFEAFGEKGLKTAASFGKVIPEVFNPFFENCGKSTEGKDILDLKKYAASNNLDYELVKTIHSISQADQLYRKGSNKVDWSKQTPLDVKNQKLIEALYKKHQTYIGKELVGKQMESVMWAIIQHSNIEMMEKYLPIIQEAVRKNDIHQTPLEMLIDRIHCIKYNYQIFGSQFGGDCKLCDREKRLVIKEKFGLE